METNYDILRKQLWDENKLAFHPKVSIPLDLRYLPIIGGETPSCTMRVVNDNTFERGEHFGPEWVGFVMSMHSIDGKPKHPSINGKPDHRRVVVVHNGHDNHAMLVQLQMDLPGPPNLGRGNLMPTTRMVAYEPRPGFFSGVQIRRRLLDIHNDINAFLLKGTVPVANH